ncbi:zeta toxin family protein [Larkinella humicola]|uniref:zeta toxin family protein n=1 Tax=Larkinella humicola TaxID=2607654 RepID=UPI001CD9DBE8|nr:zeta toxin family protein [Larkinella humicola]
MNRVAGAIAKGLSPFQPETVAFEAGRIMLHRINHLLEQNVDFALETTLSTRSYVQTIKRAKQAGYSVTLFYVWLESVELAKERVGIQFHRM